MPGASQDVDLDPLQEKEMLQSQLDFLQKQREELRQEREKESDVLLGTVASERQRLRDTFKQLQQFLQEQEGILLAQLDQADRELTKERREYLSSISERKSLLDTLIAEIEKRRDRAAVGFLTDVDETLNSEAAKVPIPEPVSPELQKSIKSLLKMSQLAVAEVVTFKENLLSTTDKERVKVRLDPETANPYLILSEDLRTVRLGHTVRKVPDNPKRFTGSSSVLGSQGFTSGRHYWELEVGPGNNWAVGVALESVQREVTIGTAMSKIWALHLDWEHRYTTFQIPPVLLVWQEELRRIRVHLDCEAGQVTFYNAESMVQVLQFEVSCTEKVFPYFCLWSHETHIQLCA